MMVEQKIKHGTDYGYSRKGCRCDECKKAKRNARKGTPVRKHGTKWGYDKGCRCDECKKAKADYWRKLHPNIKEPTTDVEKQTRKCIYCHEIKPLVEFHRNVREFLKRDYRCKICKNERSRECKNTPGHRFSTYVSGAKVRKISFGLSFEDFMLFWEEPCYYCGSEIDGIGLDRKNPSGGYDIKNVVSCCIKCNRAKTIQTTEQFIEMCLKVAEKFKNHIVSSS